MCKCCEEPNISFDDYIDLVNAQTNSVRPGWYNSLDASEKLAGIEPRDIYLHRNGSRCRQHHSRFNDVRNLASCPFKYVDNIDESRLPRRLTHTVCLCERPRHLSNNYICRSVVNYVKVFRKEGCRYISYWYPVPVACVSISLSSIQTRLATSTRTLTQE